VQPWKVVLLIVFASLAILALFYGIGGWYFAGEIYSGALQVHVPSDGPLDITFDRGEADTVVLRGDDDSANLLEDGQFGLVWESGRSLVGGIESAETPGGVSTVHRQRIAGEEIPAPGSPARLDPFIWHGDPLTALGIPFTEIDYPLEGGRAGAWYVEGTTSTWAIFVHGKGAPRTEALRLLPLAVDRGYHAMVIDYRNDPGAPPDPDGVYRYGATEWQDVAAAVRYSRSNGAQGLVMIGYSMGGANVVSFLLESPLQAQTSAAILDSPVLDFGATVGHAADQTTLPLTSIAVPGSLTAVAKWIAGWRFDVDWTSTDYVSRSRNLQTPILVFQGTGDTTVPLGPAEQLARDRPDIVTLVAPKDVGHVLSWNADQDAYESAINAFLDELGL
jgi:pimeloyl-ACP methyl ester carboxylesterase